MISNKKNIYFINSFVQFNQVKFLEFLGLTFCGNGDFGDGGGLRNARGGNGSGGGLRNARDEKESGGGLGKARGENGSGSGLRKA